MISVLRSRGARPAPSTTLLTFALPAILLAGAAFAPGAASARTGTGFRAELTTGYDIFTSHDDYMDIPDRLAGVRIGGAIGYDIALGKRLLLGVEGGLGFALGDDETKMLAKDRLTLSTGRDLDLGIRLGTPVATRTILYAKAGYANSRLKLRYDFNLGGSYESQQAARTADGLRLGAGIEHGIAGSAYLKAEYRWTRYFGDYGYQVHPTRSQILAGVGFRF